MKDMVCIVCPNGCLLTVDRKDNSWMVKGNMCPRGKDFAIREMINPERSVCSTVRTTNLKVPRIPVRTDRDVPLKRIFDVMTAINRVVVDRPVHMGEILLPDVCGTGANIIASSDTFEQLG